MFHFGPVRLKIKIGAIVQIVTFQTPSDAMATTQPLSRRRRLTFRLILATMARLITIGAIELAAWFYAHNIAKQGKRHTNDSDLGWNFVSIGNLPRRNSAGDEYLFLTNAMGLESQQMTQEIVYSGGRRLGEP